MAKKDNVERWREINRLRDERKNLKNKFILKSTYKRKLKKIDKRIDELSKQKC